MNLNGSRNSGLLSWVSSVGSGISSFDQENLPSDLPKSIFGGGDPSPTVTGIESAGFRVGPGGLGGWVGFRVPVDTPSFRSMKVEINDPKESKEQKIFAILSMSRCYYWSTIACIKLLLRPLQGLLLNLGVMNLKLKKCDF